jgi:hypothetical protein
LKVFITKYALTDGIQERDGVLDEDGKYFSVQSRQFGWSDALPKDKDAFDSKDKAIANANKRRDKKIVSLKKQIEKLQQLRFE